MTKKKKANEEGCALIVIAGVSMIVMLIGGIWGFSEIVHSIIRCNGDQLQYVTSKVDHPYFKDYIRDCYLDKKITVNEYQGVVSLNEQLNEENAHERFRKAMGE